MGLDIMVKRLKRAYEKTIKRGSFYKLINDEGDYDNHNFPKWTKELETTYNQEFYDWKKFKEEKGVDVDEMKYVEERWDSNSGFFTLEYPDTKKRIEFNFNDVPSFSKDIQIIGHEEIGYQRKGLNSKFYDDYDKGEIGYLVWSKDTLTKYKDKYCDTNEEKEDFQHNIIDAFIDGECCVAFSW